MTANNTHIKIMIAPILMAMALFFFVPTASAQNISDHKNKISEIEKEIDYLNKQISSTQKKQKNTMEELVFIQKKVSNRKKILSEID